MLFNAYKSKCIISRTSEVTNRANGVSVSFIICGNVIKNVERLPHLSHVITTNGSDKLDIMSRRNKFIGKVK